ncbi:MAG: RNA polymerase sigma factor [Clostridia bacterium]|nr:RNA polymerase sigma factor [Clostridia bacterium]
MKMSGGMLDGQAADRLILKIAAGDMIALEELYKAMYSEILGYLCSVLGGDRQTAEDLAQDTFVRVYRYAPKFAAQGKGRAWVYRIAGRLAMGHFEKNRTVTQELDGQIPDSRNVEDSAVNSAALSQAMAAITPEERQVVSLHAVSGLTLREIADILGQPLGTVKWRHAEAVKKLKKLMSE